MATSESTHRTIEDLVRAGSGLIGASTGAALGALAGGPEGAIIGAAAGSLFASGVSAVANEVKERLLGPREIQRIGAALVAAVQHYEKAIAEGRTPREDGFFDVANGRAAAEEVIEAVLLVAQREHQEKKLERLGALLANIAFDETVNAEQANLLVKLAEDLSYRQLCLIAFFGSDIGTRTRDQSYAKAGILETNVIALLVEIYMLYTRGLLNCSGTALLSIADIVPAKMRTQGIGAVLHNLMELSELPNDDILEIWGELM